MGLRGWNGGIVVEFRKFPAICGFCFAKMPGWCGAVAQLGARLDGIEEVVGSNPIGSTKFFTFLNLLLIFFEALLNFPTFHSQIIFLPTFVISISHYMIFLP
jgi:hypothetical protein